MVLKDLALGIALAHGNRVAASQSELFQCSLGPSCFYRYVVNKRFIQNLNYILDKKLPASGSVFFLLANSGMSTASLGEMRQTVNCLGGFFV